MKRKILKFFMIMTAVLAAIFLGFILFLKLWPAFGGSPSQEDREEYQRRTRYYNGKRFRNEHDFQVIRNVPEGKKDKILSNKEKEPQEKIPVKTPEFMEHPSKEDLTVTWLGHSSMLIQMHGMNILIDPVFSERSSPVGFAGNKRFSSLPVLPEDLPQIDLCILSHDHYDHMDYKTLSSLDSKIKKYIVPLGVENHLERWNVSNNKIESMAWWEETKIQGLTVGCTPARHYSGRSIGDNSQSWWASWVLKDEYHQIFESGDTGFDTHYKKIYEKYGAFDLALMDCAQYDLRWPDVHMNPEESYEAAGILGARYVMPIHWGTFTLANHPWDDPAERYAAAAKNGKTVLVTPMIGETMQGKQLDHYQNRWWKDVR